MKNLLVGLFLLSFGAFADIYQWHNIVNIRYPYGTTNNLLSPFSTIRPFQGELFRVSIPKSCGGVQVHQIQLWGRNTDFKIVPITFQLLYTENNPMDPIMHFVFRLNQGKPETILQIGAHVTSPAYPECSIAMEQATAGLINDECDFSNKICTAVFEGRSACTATSISPDLKPLTAEDSTNRCNAQLNLEKFICQLGKLPSQYHIECRILD